MERIYTEDWKEAILSDDNNEGIVLSRGLKLLHITGRRFLWNFSHKVAENKYGVPGSACRILERYLDHINEKIKCTTSNNKKKELLNKLRKEIRLLAMCSVFLSAKMCGKRSFNSSSIISSCARAHGYIGEISTQEVNKLEMDIMQAIDFKIPLWTGVDTAFMLAAEVSIDEPKAVYLVMDYVEFKLTTINRLYENSSGNYKICSIRTIHLAAGVISTIAQYVALEREEEITKVVADLTATTPANISRIRDAIISVIDETKVIQSTTTDPPDSDSDSSYF